MPTIRTYRPTDETSWLRCRVLGFLGTDYYDDVWTRRPDNPVQLVAVEADDVVGLLDVDVDVDLATIDTVAVHPDRRGRGVATALLAEALRQLPPSVTTLDAWTREDAPAHAWYRSLGMTESEHYLHVYLGWDEPSDGFTAPDGLSSPVTAFCHAPLQREAELRARYRRVYVCRRFSRELSRP